MDILKTTAEIRAWVKEQREKGFAIHLVPTMGYFHEGHLTLMRQAQAPNAKVVVSLFVNPKQFGPLEDLSVYPRDIPRDSAMSESAGVDAMFIPPVKEMYPSGFQTTIALPEISKGLCGRYRPSHFPGVALIVLKLFNLVQPDRAYFGQKDYQQLQVIKQLVIDLNLPVKVIGCPIVREEDGLAMSSRNIYLSPEERVQATVINKSLTRAQSVVKAGERDTDSLIEQVKEWISQSPLANIQYLEIVHPDTLDPIHTIEDQAVLAIAVHFGKTRLIDNILLES
ncbi:MAG: pantoate--beta-alanine ligase [bacterium]